jgi:hypothetical protein
MLAFFMNDLAVIELNPIINDDDVVSRCLTNPQVSSAVAAIILSIISILGIKI